MPNATFYFWEFGDNYSQLSNVTEQNPEHLYQTFDTFEVRLVAYFGTSCDTVIDTLILPCPDNPIAEFSYTGMIDTFHFQEEVAWPCDRSDLDLKWDFGDGTFSTLLNPSHTYPLIDTNYDVCLTATNRYDTTVSNFICHSLTTGGTYTVRDFPTKGNRPIFQRTVPYDWLAGLPRFPRDTNRNQIEDRLDTVTTGLVDIMLALNRCERDSNGIGDSLHYSQWGNVISVSRFISLITMEGVSFASLDTLANDTAVVMVFYDGLERVLATDTSSYLLKVGNLNGMGIGKTIQDSFPETDGRRTMVAVLDTGIDEVGDNDLPETPGLWAYKVKDSLSYDFILDQHINPRDPNGHGTLMAQVIAGGWSREAKLPPFGVAPRTRLVDVRVVDSLGFARKSDVIKGLEWVLKHREIKIALMALNFPDSTNGHDPISELVNIATAQDLLVVAAAGNNRQQAVGIPGSAQDALTISNGFNLTLDPQLMQIHPNTAQGNDSLYGLKSWKPELISPGTRIGLYDEFKPILSRKQTTGTSVAAAQVAGIAALIESEKPELGGLAIRELLIATNTDLQTPGWDSLSGYGVPNVYKAIDTLKSSPPIHVGFPEDPSQPPYNSIAINTDGVTNIQANQPVSVVVELVNNGTQVVEGGHLRLWGSRFGTLDEQWIMADSQLVRLDPGINQIDLTFTPKVDLESMCFKAQFDHPLDTSFNDNLARKNFTNPEISATLNQTHQFEFFVSNPTNKTVTLELRQKVLAPTCWKVEFSVNTIVMGPNDCPVRVTGTAIKDYECCDRLIIQQSNARAVTTLDSSGCCLSIIEISVEVFAISGSPTGCATCPLNGCTISSDTFLYKPIIITQEPQGCGILTDYCAPCHEMGDTTTIFLFDSMGFVIDSILSGDSCDVHLFPVAGVGTYTTLYTNNVDTTQRSQTDTVVAPVLMCSSQDTGLTVTLTCNRADFDSCTTYWGDGSSSPGTVQTHTYAVPGMYRIETECSGSCGTDTSITIANLAVGLRPPLLQKDLKNLKIHPNPTFDKIHLTSDSKIDGTLQVTLFNSAGIPILREKVPGDVLSPQGFELDLSHFSAGFHKLVVRNDGKVVGFSIIKQ